MSTESIKDLREEFNCTDPNMTHSVFEVALDRLEAAEVLTAKLQQRFLDLESVVDWKGLFNAERLDRERLAARIKELEAAQQPRAMADAPRDTDIMLTIGARYQGDEDEPYRMGLLGWLHLPDREDSPESPGIGASGKTEGV